MIIAPALELAILFVMLRAADMRTHVVGGILWCAYFRYSASRAALENLAEVAARPKQPARRPGLGCPSIAPSARIRETR
jgi:hypothetical protein